MFYCLERDKNVSIILLSLSAYDFECISFKLSLNLAKMSKLLQKKLQAGIRDRAIGNSCDVESTLFHKHGTLLAT